MLAGEGRVGREGGREGGRDGVKRREDNKRLKSGARARELFTLCDRCAVFDVAWMKYSDK